MSTYKRDAYGNPVQVQPNGELIPAPQAVPTVAAPKFTFREELAILLLQRGVEPEQIGKQIMAVERSMQDVNLIEGTTDAYREYSKIKQRLATYEEAAFRLQNMIGVDFDAWTDANPAWIKATDRIGDALITAHKHLDSFETKNVVRRVLAALGKEYAGAVKALAELLEKPGRPPAED